MPRMLHGGLAALFFLFAAGLCWKTAELTDGVYEGEYSFVRVAVTVEDGAVTQIKILEHGGGGEEYERMVEPLKEKIIAEQITDIDAISGATVSSENLKKAVEDAIEKAGAQRAE